MYPQDTLFIMLKYPRAGRVKTRLGRAVGQGRAVNIYRGLMSHIFRKLCSDPRWETVLCISPDTEILAKCWPLNIWRCPQGGGDLGDRMGRVMKKMPAGRVVIIGADSPQVNRNDIALAFSALKKNDVVLGPTNDGGYWLVGQKGLKRREIFRHVRWSCSDTYSDTVRNCEGLKLGTLRKINDIDEYADYQAWLRAGVV